MALTADTVKAQETQQARLDKFLIFFRNTHSEEDYQDLVSSITNLEKRHEFLRKHPEIDPNLFPVQIAIKPDEHTDQTGQPTMEESFMAGFQSTAGNEGGGSHPHTPEPEVIVEDERYHELASKIKEEWLISNNQKGLDTQEGLDFLFGSLDDPLKPSLDAIAHERFRSIYAKNALYYDKLKEEDQKKISKKPEEDNAFTRARQKVEEEYEARVKLREKEAKQKGIQLNKAAVEIENRQLKEKVEKKVWKQFATEYQEKALVYANYHEGLTPILPTIKQKKQDNGPIDAVNGVYNQYQNVSSVSDFFNVTKNVFFGDGATPAAETAVVGGEGLAAASEIAAMGEGAAMVGGGAAASEAAAVGATAAAVGEGATLTGGTAAAASGATVAVAGGAATAAVGWPIIIIILIALLLLLFVLSIVILIAVIGGAGKGGENNQSSTESQQPPIPSLTLNLDGPTEIPNSTNITYTIKALYAGALDVTISDPLPSNTTLVSATGVYTQENNAIRWELKDNVSATGTASGVLKDYSFTLVLNPTSPDILVKNKIIATSQGVLAGTMKEILVGQDQPLSGKGLSLKGQIDSLLRQYPGNIAVYKEAEKATGVPWQVLAGLHYIEGTMRPDASLVSGRPIGGNEPDVVRGGGCTPTNEPGKPRPVSGGCGFPTLLDTAIYAGNHLKGKVNMLFATFDDTVTALSRYNGGGNRNCAQPTDAANPRTPWNGCPRLFIGEDDPYVLNLFDARHENMYLVFCADLTMCNPPRLFGERLGSMTVARIVAESTN